ncbi:MAG: HAD family hydrolase [Candidatus Melainabacteria bacterium]|nr:HAD family hydrolase [Candidatus Melainabacteria bacterium]
MTLSLESFNPDHKQTAPSWTADVAREAYTGPSFAPAIDFVKDNWKEIAGVGVLTAAGALIIASHGSGLGAFTRLLKGGESAAAIAEAGTVGSEVSPSLLGRLKAVDHYVFDMDRTLVDHDKALAALTTTMTDELVRTTGLSKEFIGEALTDTTQRLKSPYFWNRLDEIRPLQQQFPGVNLNERFAEVSRNSHAAFYDALKANPETTELLTYLKDQGKSVHVFTAGSPARALEKLTGAGLIDKVDNIYTSGLNAFEDSATSGLLTKETTSAKLIALPAGAKTSGSGYPLILENLAAKPQSIAMTGDHVVEDVARAKELGMFASQAKWYRAMPTTNIFPGFLPDLELTSPSQLTAIVKKLPLAS